MLPLMTENRAQEGVNSGLQLRICQLEWGAGAYKFTNPPTFSEPR